MSASTRDDRYAGRGVRGHRRLQPLVDGAPVGQAGQRVLERQPLDAGEVVGLHDAGRDLGRDRLAKSRSARPNRRWPVVRVANSSPQTRASTTIGVATSESLPSAAISSASSPSSSAVPT